MPIHDWTRVGVGTWHDFHLVWIAEIRNVLNDGLLPSDYYAQAEQIIGPLGPDVLTLQTPETAANPVVPLEGRNLNYIQKARHANHPHRSDDYAR